jgi:hypothetical protein
MPFPLLDMLVGFLWYAVVGMAFPLLDTTDAIACYPYY